MDVSSLTTAPTWLGAGLLVVAGVGKLDVPDGAMTTLHSLRLPSGRVAARVVGLGEIAVGLVVLLVGGLPAAIALAVVYAVLLAVAARQRAKQLDCGCFGITAPVTVPHLTLNAAMAVTGLAGVAGAPLSLAAGPLSLAAVAGDDGLLVAVAGLLLLATGVGLLRTVLTEAAKRSTLRRVVGNRVVRA
ncbi:hypothetical protein BH23ACT9_BH23ACT9_30410 [soil metagenome]